MHFNTYIYFFVFYQIFAVLEFFFLLPHRPVVVKLLHIKDPYINRNDCDKFLT